MSAIATHNKPTVPVHARVLVVDDEPALVELIHDAVGRQLDATILVAQTIAEARQILATQPVELVVADVHLPDGDGTSLLPVIQKYQPLTRTIVITGSPSLDGAIAALREGAVDFVLKPFTVDVLIGRVREALRRQAAAVRSENRVEKLRAAVRKLNDARKLVTKKVDLLCNDLVNAYGELSRQLDTVRTTESFRSVLGSANDLEQMLCHAMDWIIRQLGYSNLAIWLAGDEGFQLGAYMKYTHAGDDRLTGALRSSLLPHVVRDGFVHLEAKDLSSKLSPAEQAMLPNQTMLAAHCTYLGESLAAVMLFRDASTPFNADDGAVLRAIAPVFAVALASIVRAAEKDEPADDPFYAGDEEENRDRPRSKKNEADWWKRGEPPPF